MGVKPKPGQRRERKHQDGVLYLRCFGVFHDGDWLHFDRFQQRSENQFSTLCKECRAYKDAHDRGYSRMQRLELVRKWIYEIVHRCGGYRAAARTLGISYPTLFRWLGRYSGYEQRWIRRDSVRLILTTLAGLRSGEITPVKAKHNGGRKYRYGCAGCGCDLELITPGCETCRDRDVRRKFDAKQDREMLRKKWREQQRARRERLKLVA